MKSALILPSSLCVLGLFILTALYGPPAAAPLAGGPVLINVLPYTINTPGAYCLSGNLTGMAGQDGIRIEVDNVTLDLGGFVLEGVPGSGSAIRGNFDHITVKNGVIQGWGEYGVLVRSQCVIRDLSVRDCTDSGIAVFNSSIVRDCITANNAVGNPSAYEIVIWSNSSIIDCHVKAGDSARPVVLQANGLCQRVQVEGGEIAFDCNSNSRLEDCTAESFKDVGIKLAGACSVVDCTLRGYPGGGLELYSATGILAGHSTRIDGCTVDNYIKVGIDVGEYSSIKDTIVSHVESDGIRCGSGGRISETTVALCGLSRSSVGIRAGNGTRIEGATTAQNNGAGILTPEGEPALVEGCVSMENSGAGLKLQGPSWARNNWVLGNFDNGIHATGGSHFIEGNNTPQNLNGIVVSGQGTLLSGNRATGNLSTDFIVAPGNPMGPILYGGGQISTSNPQANFKTLYP